jgi:tetratricopeptide (TPR) repeat protein
LNPCVCAPVPRPSSVMKTPAHLRSNTVLAAYRAANKRSAHVLSSDDGTWLQVGALLEHAAMLPVNDRTTHLEAVARTVRTSIGDTAWRLGHRSDPPTIRDEHSLESRLRIFCEVVEDAGAIEVSDAILAAYIAAAVAMSPVESARIEAVRARLGWKRGDLDVAVERYRRVAQVARRIDSDELRSRAWNGRAIVARLRGNYPESRRCGRRAVALAEGAGLNRLASAAHQVLMVAEAVANAFDLAVHHGWQAYLRAEKDTALEAAALGNIGQLFLDAGHPETALSAFLAVLAREPADRIRVPALGGLAIAAARVGRPDIIDRVTAEFTTGTASNAAPYDVATAVLDLSRAHRTLHNTVSAERFRTRAREIALQFGYHEIVHHTTESVRVQDALPRVRALSPKIETVAIEVRHLAGV